MAAAAAPVRAWDMAAVSLQLPEGLGERDCALAHPARLRMKMAT